MDKLDILNREEFVNQLVSLVENISDNKTSTCFAINGEWGSGKSFVLDMFEEKLVEFQSEDTYTDKYFIIRYNSWQYDYYEEPLIAIVATMISLIEEKTKLFPDSKEKREILGMLKAAGVSLLSLGNAVIKEKTGMDFQNAYETVLKGEKTGAEAYAKDNDYDMYFSFNKVMDKMSTLLQDLAKNYTIIIIVDELDRCMPEYAIKVLERLHHLTEDNTNTITIIAIDKKQLLFSVKQIFGFENPEKYLEKFLNFEIKLDYGIPSERIVDKYASYIEMFDKELFQFDDSVEEYLQALFKNIDIRTQEQIVNKSTVAHKLLFADKKDYTFMCMELLTAVMLCVYKYRGLFVGSKFNVSSYGGLIASTSRQNSLPFEVFLKEKIESINLRNSHSFSDEPAKYVLPEKANLYGAILFTWCWMHSKRTVSIQHTKGDVYSTISNNHTELIKFAEMINLMQ